MLPSRLISWRILELCLTTRGAEYVQSQFAEFLSGKRNRRPVNKNVSLIWVKIFLYTLLLCPYVLFLYSLRISCELWPFFLPLCLLYECPPWASVNVPVCVCVCHVPWVRNSLECSLVTCDGSCAQFCKWVSPSATVIPFFGEKKK